MIDESSQAPSQDRRRFLTLMGLACATTALSHPVTAIAQPPPAPTRPATPATPPSPAAAETKPPSAEALAVGQLVRLRYPGALNDDQLKALVEDIDSRLESGRDLRKLAFANGDEPDMTFHA